MNKISHFRTVLLSAHGLLCAGLIGLTSSAQSALSVSAIFDDTDSVNASAFAGNVSTADLLSAVGTSVDSFTGAWSNSGGAGVAGEAGLTELTDGLHGGAFTGWTTVTVGASVTYDLGVGTGFGWDLDTVRSISAFGVASLANQEFTFEYETVSGGGFSTLGTFGPVDTSAATVPGTYYSTQITLTNSTEPLASGVRYVRFTARPTTDSNPAFRELDVIGTPTVGVPEPSSAALVGLGCLSLAFRRRKP